MFNNPLKYTDRTGEMSNSEPPDDDPGNPNFQGQFGIDENLAQMTYDWYGDAWNWYTEQWAKAFDDIGDFADNIDIENNNFL